MKNLLRLALLAAVTSLSLTSCFDHDKKCDPKPTTCTGSHGGSTNTGNPN